MAGPIYRVFFVNYKDAWYKLSQEEQNKLNEQNAAFLKELGAELVILCISAWASEEWLGWGVEKYPDIEAVQKQTDHLISLNWFHYMETKTYLGTEFVMPGS